MLRFRPDVKPPMWGPMSAVQYAVRANAEKLGLNPVCFVPFWEFGGATQVYDVFGGVVTPQPTNTEWDWSGLRTGSPTNLDTGIFIYPRTPVSNQSASLIFGLRALESLSSSMFKDFVSVGAGTSWRASISKPSNDYDFISYGNTTGWSGGVIITIQAAETVPIALSLDRAASSKRLYVAEKTTSSLHTPTDENLNAIRLFNRLGDNNRTTRGTALYFGLFDSPLTQAQATRFEYEPYTLLMPVARPLYFDLGATAGTDNLAASDLVTGSPVLGTPALGQVHALTATGVTTSAPVVGTPALGQVHELTVTALTVSAPVLGTPSLTENAADVDAMTAVDLVVGSPVLGTPAIGQIHVLGSDGMVTGAPVLGSPSITQIHTLEALGLTVGVPVLGTPALNGSDIVLITAAEVARIVRATSRMKTVTASARVKQVRYEVTRA